MLTRPFISHKSMKVKLQPPSATELAPFNPILPPASITQIMLLVNPTKVGDTITHKNTNHKEFLSFCSWQLMVIPKDLYVCMVCLHRRRCVCVTSWPSRSETVRATRSEKSTSSPHKRHGVIYSSEQACYGSAGTDRHVLCEGVCSPQREASHSL